MTRCFCWRGCRIYTHLARRAARLFYDKEAPPCVAGSVRRRRVSRKSCPFPCCVLERGRKLYRPQVVQRHQVHRNGGHYPVVAPMTNLYEGGVWHNQPHHLAFLQRHPLRQPLLVELVVRVDCRRLHPRDLPLGVDRVLPSTSPGSESSSPRIASSVPRSWARSSRSSIVASRAVYPRCQQAAEAD
eukprot:349546-Pleurochrysis_carterae.AAC.2